MTCNIVQAGRFCEVCHNKLRDITGAQLEEVCYDVAIKSILQPVTYNTLVPSTSNTNDGDRLEELKNVSVVGSNSSIETSRPEGYI